MNNQWSDNLRKRMGMHQEPPPEGLWEGVEQIIQNENSIKSSLKQKKNLLWSKRIGAVAAIAIVILLVGYHLSDQNQKDRQLAKQTTRKQSLPETNLIAQNWVDNLVTEEDSQSFFKKIDAKKLVSEKNVSTIDTIHLLAKVEDVTSEEKAENHTSQPNSKTNKADNNYLYLKDTQNIEPEVDLFKSGQKNKPAKWATNIYASNMAFGSADKYSGYGGFICGKILFDENDENPVLQGTPYENILLENKYKEVYTDVNHRQPISVGASVNYNIDDNWSITSGLTYTILSSQLCSGSENHYCNSEQTLHNIGVPLNINYSVWRNKKISTYLSGGGLVEKNLSGKLTMDYIVDNKLSTSDVDEISIDELQWSLNASVGIQYNISKKIGIYAEPGISYYFKNGSEVKTIYNEQPINLSIRFGLRFSLGK